MLNTIKKIALIGLLMYQINGPTATLSAKEAYEYGHVVMQSKDWREAIKSFEQAAKDQKLKSAAQYWQAYAHYQLKQKAQAKRLLERLIKSDPDSEWVDDAEVLLFEHGDSGEQAIHQAALDDELKLFTIQQIMFNNPEKALPKVYQLLEQSNSIRVKQNAIQLLGLSDQTEVVDYLFRYIQRETNEGLQNQAIQMLSLRDGAATREKLAKLYDQSESQDIKAAIIQGFIHHDDSSQLIKLLKKEKDEELSLYLIQMLGIKGESEVLKDMYQSSEGQQKRAIMESLALSGDAEYLYYVIDNEDNQEIRNQAIHSLVMVNDKNLGDYLVKLYKQAKNPSEKDVIASVFIATGVDPDVIVELMQSETNKERRHGLLNALMAMDAVDQMRTLYLNETDDETKQAIIHQLGAMGATDVLMELYKKDPTIANDSAFYHAFGMTSEALDEAFLIEQFKTGNSNIKEAVLNALMMQNDTDTMLKLFKAEKDYEVKKQIIKMIGVTNPEALIEAIEDQ